MGRRSNDTGALALAWRADKRRTERDRVESCIRDAGHGLTILEIETRTGIVSSTVSARLADLRKENRIHESLIRRKCTVNGMRKKLWVIACDTGQLLLGRLAS